MPITDKASRICLLVNSLSGGGGETVALLLARVFKEQGIDVFLVCMEKNEMLDTSGVDVHTLSEHSGTESSLLKILYLPLYAWRLKKFLRSNSIALVQSHIYRANYVNVLARLFGSQHAVQLVNHGIASRYRSMGLMGRVNLALIKSLYPRADQVLCPSTAMMQDLESCDVPTEKMCLVPNPFQLDVIAAASKESLPDEYLDQTAGRKVIVSVGRFESVKKVSDIIEAFKGVHEVDKNALLVLVGDGSERLLLEKKVIEYGLGGNVIMTGYVSNPFTYIANANMLVTASEYEGFSNVIIESLALDISVISTDCPGGPREILSEEYDAAATILHGEVELGDYGLLVPVGDTVALQNAMKRMLVDDVLRNNYAEKGPVRAADYTTEKIVQRHIELMNGLRTKV